MQTVKIGKHTVEMYDTIEELPIVRFHKYQKLLLIDAGIGADINAFDQRIERTRRYLMDGKPEKAQRELENLRQSVFFIQSGINPKYLSFACLVFAIDGVKCTDLSDDGLRKTLEIFADSPNGDLTARLEAVKKKIDAELRIYFPHLFADSEVKEYFDILRRRTITVLENIVKGLRHPDKTKAVEELTTKLITYSNPKSFVGSDGAEVQFDRQFENLCLAISEQLHIKPKECSVLEFYNAFDFLQERAKQAEKAKRGRN